MELWFAGLDLFVSGQPMDTEGDFTNYVRRIERGPQQVCFKWQCTIVLIIMYVIKIIINLNNHLEDITVSVLFTKQYAKNLARYLILKYFRFLSKYSRSRVLVAIYIWI